MSTKDAGVCVPDLSDELVASIDRMFPEQSADLNWSDREVWFKAGQRYVVRFLLEQHSRQRDPTPE